MTSESRRVLYVLAGRQRGGAEISLYLLLSGLDRNRYEPRLVLPASPLAGWYRGLGIPLLFYGRRMRVLRFLNRWRIRSWARRHLGELRRERISLIHANSIHAAEAGQVIGRLLDVPVVVHWRDNAVPEWLRPVFNRGALHVIAPSPAVSATVADSGLPVASLAMIPNGVDRQVFHPRDRRDQRRRLGLPEDGFLVGFFGVLNRHKGCHVLLDVAETWTDPRRLLVIAGDWGSSGYRREMQARLRSERLAGRVRFLGHRDDIPELLAALDVVAAPSATEAMPRVGLEALASGVPVLAHPAGGYRDLITDGENGFLIPFDDRAAWQRRIDQLAGDPVLLAALSRNALASSAAYDHGFTVDRIMARYDELLMPSSPARVG